MGNVIKLPSYLKYRKKVIYLYSAEKTSALHTGMSIKFNVPFSKNTLLKKNIFSCMLVFLKLGRISETSRATVCNSPGEHNKQQQKGSFFFPSEEVLQKIKTEHSDASFLNKKRK